MIQRENGTPRAMEFRHPGPDPRLGGGWDLRCRFADRRWTCDDTSVRPNQAECAAIQVADPPAIPRNHSASSPAIASAESF